MALCACRELRVSPRSFHPAATGPSTSVHPGTGTGTTITYTDTQPASTRIKILHCTGPHGRCSQQKLIATLTHHDQAGTTRSTSPAVSTTTRCSPGRYALQLIASRKGHSTPLITATFTILPTNT